MQPDLVDIHKAFLKPKGPLLSRTTARRIATGPHGETWQTHRVPGALARARGERQMVGGLNTFTTGHNPKSWEVEQGVRQGVRQARVGTAKRMGRKRLVSSTGAALPQAPAPVTPEWLR